jgi:hypothetical protein
MRTTFEPALEADRVRQFTEPEMLRKIDEQIEHNVAYYASQPDEVIEERIQQLKEEWSINRYLQANVAAVGLLGAVMGLVVSKKWAVLTIGGFGFFLFHGLHGWDPRIRPLRRLGARTRSEIDRELYALKTARGDFKNVTLPTEESVPAPIPLREIMQAVNA